MNSTQLLPTQDADAFTYGCWTDLYPATIVKRTAHTITTRDDNYRVVEGSTHDGSAKYEYTTNEQGAQRTWRKNKAGRWVSKGYKGSEGHRRADRDPSF
jgi:hypothetical protein